MADRSLVKPQGNPAGFDKDFIDQLNRVLGKMERRIEELEARLQAGYVLAAWRGSTVVGGDPVTTKATNLQMLTSTINSIDFLFTERKPKNTRYTVHVTNQDGTAAIATCAITANTINAFRFRPLSGQVTFNPQSAVVEIEIIVIESP